MAKKNEAKKKVSWEKTRNKWQQKCPSGTHRVGGKRACVKAEKPMSPESVRRMKKQAMKVKKISPTGL